MSEDYENQNWVRVQKKTFTRWVNTYLVERMQKVNDLTTDLSDGLFLMSLLEIISSKVVAPNFNKAPKMRVQKIENVNFSLQFLTKEGIKLVGIDGVTVVDGNIKLILGLIWTIILRYQIQVNEGNSARKELLEWVRSQIPEYDIQNFGADWSSGRAICALAEAVHPGQMRLPQDFTNNAIENARMGITKAHQNMGIDMLVDPEDMCGAPDELSNMTYISYFRDYWNQMMEKLAWPGTTFIKSFQAVVQTRTRANKDKDIGGDVLAVDVAGPGGAVQTNVQDHGNGTYTISYSAPAIQPGNYKVSIKLQNKDIVGSPFSTSF